MVGGEEWRVVSGVGEVGAKSARWGGDREDEEEYGGEECDAPC